MVRRVEHLAGEDGGDMGNRHTPWLSGRVGLVHADENVHAARQLRSRVPGIEWVDLGTADAATDLPVVELVNDPSRVEGSFSITRADSEGAPRIAVVGDRFSGVIYGANELAD